MGTLEDLHGLGRLALTNFQDELEYMTKYLETDDAAIGAVRELAHMSQHFAREMSKVASQAYIAADRAARPTAWKHREELEAEVRNGEHREAS